MAPPQIRNSIGGTRTAGPKQAGPLGRLSAVCAALSLAAFRGLPTQLHVAART